MTALLSIALTLISNVTDLTHMFMVEKDDPPPMTFYFENRHEAASFAIFDDQGDAQPDVLRQFSHFVRCWRTNREKTMHPRTVEIVSNIAKHFRVHRIDVVSGYRSRPYGAPHSKHFLGNAMDIHVPGVNSKFVADWVWQNFRHIGVGYYPKQNFVHVDTRDLDVRWVDFASHGESARAHYTGRQRSQHEPPPSAPVLAYDRAHPNNPVESDVELVAVEHTLTSSYDPLRF